MRKQKKSAASSDGKSRVLIVDDHPITREGLASLIRQTGDLTVCGEASDAAQSIAMVRLLKPDIVLADISLPGRSGLELVKYLHIIDPDLPMLVISMHDEALYAERALRAGARGYIMKQEGGDRLIEGIRQVLGGKIFLSHTTSSDLLEDLSKKGPRKSAVPLRKLTDREFEIFRLLGEGLSNVQIAERLNVSRKTIEAHRGNIKAKLQFETAAQLITFAARWISTESSSHRRKK